ncbi:acetyltransferase [Cyclobacterium marinum]|uniref:Sugar O-acyltransferase, sialic acid O-acetyltransferase NeuD family n=1 Tax=Cyclobacterium marinum (strain ATCC 25205 / DSM 745 / LMG 13164 / NCIMB 1802) TaxID=880070 RepID=G0IZU7_CYCMS|nr:acetyltransferase [Cyclobacterium marinum]AEL25761.1 sugar O-acyltransferase, sialic acid O-acetyltransferase NeuD family [Cyclobacterium marinum DSM 745]MBI0401193.1 acetyltransferase [Cyclobacterium marinum]MBR9773940.1 acetyltransferase [Cytophagales bacterium]|tara:strand:+ start:42134 stop:42772 length:639 start_codon:yes stop_codon:yes gene_type:complete
MEKPIIIFGAKGIAHPALEIFNSHDAVVYGFLDDDASLHQKEINNVAILGKLEDDGFLKLIGKKCEAFVAVDDPKYRESLVKLLNERRKVQPVNALHRLAYISTDAGIGHGNFINAKVTIGAGAEIGNHCILHTNATIEHQAKIGDFVQVGAGAVINSGVTIENGVFIGSGVTIVSGVKIGKNARIGAGSVVIADIEAKQTVFGNPAQVIDK